MLDEPEIAVAATLPDGSCRVLVVDDETDSADLLCAVLRRLGFEAQSAHDGAAALQAVRDWLPEVVLLDLGLPGMNGYELAPRLRRAAAGRELHVIALTGSSDETARERSRAAGCERHLVKGVALERLVATINASMLHAVSRSSV